MRDIFSCFRRLIADRKGVTAMEYGVIAAAIVVTGLATLPTLSDNLASTFTSVGGKLTQASK